MRNGLLQYFHTIRARILLSTISLIVIISTIISSISYVVVSSNLQKNLIQTSETKLAYLCTSINTNINNVTYFIRSCRTSSKIRDFALEEDADDNKLKMEAHDFIDDAYKSNSALRSQVIRLIVIGKSRDDMIQIVQSPYSSVTVSAKSILSLPYFNVLQSTPGKVSAEILTDPFITTKTVYMIPLIQTIPHPYKAGDIGYIFTEMSPSVIIAPLQNYISETSSQFYLHIGNSLYKYENDTLIPYTGAFNITNNLSDQAMRNDTVVQRILNPDGRSSSILLTRPLDTKGWYITECLDESILSRNILKAFLLIALIILTASILIGILLSLYLFKTVNVPVKKLQKRMVHIANGDFSRDPSIEWNHELGDIGKNINDLSENVNFLMNQRIEDERKKNEYEYKMLQSQINPHFLYNTLNSIKWMATIQNAPGIAEMIIALSRLLKDISKGTSNLITLKHELSLINDYFTIQKYRYGGTITLHCNIADPVLNTCSILKFTLQPIVENAIFHGIEPKGGVGTITIQIYQDENTDIHIDITDNGIGMEPEKAALLLNNDYPGESSFFKEIGISNVHKRLQYEFGNKYGLSITSSPNEFTTISILLPFSFQSSEDYQEAAYD